MVRPNDASIRNYRRMVDDPGTYAQRAHSLEVSEPLATKNMIRRIQVGLLHSHTRQTVNTIKKKETAPGAVCFGFSQGPSVGSQDRPAIHAGFTSEIWQQFDRSRQLFVLVHRSCTQPFPEHHMSLVTPYPVNMHPSDTACLIIQQGSVYTDWKLPGSACAPEHMH